MSKPKKQKAESTAKSSQVQKLNNVLLLEEFKSVKDTVEAVLNEYILIDTNKKTDTESLTRIINMIRKIKGNNWVSDFSTITLGEASLYNKFEDSIKEYYTKKNKEALIISIYNFLDKYRQFLETESKIKEQKKNEGGDEEEKMDVISTKENDYSQLMNPDIFLSILDSSIDEVYGETSISNYTKKIENLDTVHSWIKSILNSYKNDDFSKTNEQSLFLFEVKKLNVKVTTKYITHIDDYLDKKTSEITKITNGAVTDDHYNYLEFNLLKKGRLFLYYFIKTLKYITLYLDNYKTKDSYTSLNKNIKLNDLGSLKLGNVNKILVLMTIMSSGDKNLFEGYLKEDKIFQLKKYLFDIEVTSGDYESTSEKAVEAKEKDTEEYMSDDINKKDGEDISNEFEKKSKSGVYKKGDKGIKPKLTHKRKRKRTDRPIGVKPKRRVVTTSTTRTYIEYLSEYIRLHKEERMKFDLNKGLYLLQHVYPVALEFKNYNLTLAEKNITNINAYGLLYTVMKHAIKSSEKDSYPIISSVWYPLPGIYSRAVIGTTKKLNIDNVNFYDFIKDKTRYIVIFNIFSSWAIRHDKNSGTSDLLQTLFSALTEYHSLKLTVSLKQLITDYDKISNLEQLKPFFVSYGYQESIDNFRPFFNYVYGKIYNVPVGLKEIPKWYHLYYYLAGNSKMRDNILKSNKFDLLLGGQKEYGLTDEIYKLVKNTLDNKYSNDNTLKQQLHTYLEKIIMKETEKK